MKSLNKNAFLLDTHILLWWLSHDKKLIKKIMNIIEDPNNSIFVSAVTIWEISIKRSLKKLKAPDDLKEVLQKNDIKILPMTEDHALYIEHLPFIHDDPFDRLLIAQSIIEHLTFITHDKNIQKYPINFI